MSALTQLQQNLELSSPFPDLSPTLAQARQELVRLGDRLRHAHQPLVVTICGPTGAGKSHLLNHLAGAQLSLSSVRRPSTAAPVLIGRASTLAILADPYFLPNYIKISAPDGAHFTTFPANNPELSSNENQLLVVPLPSNSTPAWEWPPELVIIDTPDFDSVRLENQRQAQDMAGRADVIILVIHQAKYADQSVWDFLREQSKIKRPFFIVLNRFSAPEARDDFLNRLPECGFQPPVILWPQESFSENPPPELGRQLTILAGQCPQITRQGGHRSLLHLKKIILNDLLPPLRDHRQKLTANLAKVREVADSWQNSPRQMMKLNLPGQTQASLKPGLEALVQRSDLWAKPRRLLGKPFLAAGRALKTIFGSRQTSPSPEKQLAQSLVQVGQETLVQTVKKQTLGLGQAAGLPAPQTELDFTTAEIRAKYDDLNQNLEQWLTRESKKLLAGLPLAPKAALYFVQFTHLSLVGGLWLYTGGLPGTEVLVGSALGPVLSKITGTLISKEALSAFEEKTSHYHQQLLAAIFHEQSQRYDNFVQNELDKVPDDNLFILPLSQLEQEANEIWA